MTQLHVQMALNLCDQDNADSCRERFSAKNNAEAVALALDIVSTLGRLVGLSDELFVRKANGEVHQLRIEGLNG